MHQVVAWIGVCARGVRANGHTGTAIIAMVGALCAAVLLSWPAGAQAQSWQYVYDEVGRLKAAIAPTGERADYEYDAVGNIIAIRRSAAGALDISEFTPQSGKSGTVVKIAGSGFSTTLASNVVKFNGVTATVTAATVTQLTVTAPATGSTGPISVTVGANTVTSRESFVYSSTIITGAPTIATATPTCAVPGDTVALSGTNFDVAPGATRVELGNVVAPTTVTSPTALSFVVPRGGTSALRVVTALGISATSTQLLVPPAGVCADYEAPVRPVLDGATATLNIATGGKKAVVLFSGNANAALSLQFSSLAPSIAGTAFYYTIYNTANAVVGSGALSSGAMSIHVPVLPVTGTYAVVFSWNNTAVTGTAAFQLQSNALLSTSGTALPISVAGPAGQSTRVAFVGTAGQDWTFELSGLTLGSGGQFLAYQVVRSDGVGVLNSACNSSGVNCSGLWLGMTAGTHTVELTPFPANVTASVTLKSWASSRVTGALTVGTANTFTSTVPGQVVQKTFSGTAGQQLGLSLASFTTSVSGATLNAVVLKPDGTPLANTTFAAATTVDVPVLPTTGTYTVQVYPYTKHVTTFTGQVLVTQDVAATLATNGTPTAVNLAQPGQQARVTFVGTAGQDWTIELSGLTLGTGGQYLSYQVVRSDGVNVLGDTCYPTGAGCSKAWLGMTAGTHTAVLTPSPGNVTASVTLKSWASTRVTGTLTVGTANTFTSTVPGQVVEKTFSGTAGQQLGLSLASFTTSVSGATLNAVVLKPDGTPLANTTFAAATTVDVPVLPTTGTYTVQVYPYTKHVTTFTGQVLVTQDVAATLATNGTPTAVSLTQPGQQARVTFVGTAGQDWTIELSGLTLGTGGQYLSYQVVRSDGVNVLGDTCYPTGAGCSKAWLGMTAGTHTVVLTPSPGNVTASVTLKSWASTRVTGTLTVGTANTFTSTVPGQVVQKTFSGTAGQQLGLSLASFTTSVSGATLNAIVLKPDGTPLTSTTFTAANGIDVPVLPTTGAYTVQVYPFTKHATTFTGQVLVLQDVAATLATNGTPTAVSLTQPGQQARVTFVGTAGQDWTLELSGLTLGSGGQYLMYQVFRSDGSSVFNDTCYPSGVGCSKAWLGMAAGTHTVVLTPYPSSVTASVTLKSWASSRVTGALTVGTANTFTSTVPGQVVEKTFSGTAGQQLGLSLASFTTSVSGATLNAVVLKPDGTPLANTTFTAANTTPTAWVMNVPVLPTTGTYTVQVHPYTKHVTTFSGQVLVTQDVAATLATNGTPTAVSLTQPGQQARVTFVGTAGQDWTIELSGLTLGSGGQYLMYQVFRSDGSSVLNDTCYPSGVGCSKAWLGMTAGTHTVELTPFPANVTASVTLKSWASSRVTGALTVGTANTFTSTVPGQVVQKTFSGTAGQQLGLSLASFTTSVSGATLNAVVLKPDGTPLANTTFAAATTVDVPVLPTTGTYTVQVYPYTKHVTTFTGQVLVLQDVAATLATNGTPTAVSLTQPGQQARVTFVGTAGQDWTIELSGLTLGSGGQYLTYDVVRSDGVRMFTGFCTTSGSGCANAWQGITSGTHTIVLTPYPSSATASVTLKSWASSRVTGALTVGTANTFTSTVPGQVVEKTFSGTAGQQLALSLASFTTSVSGASLTAVVLKPDGNTLGSVIFTGAETTLNPKGLRLPVLPTTGTYTVRVYPITTNDSRMTTTFTGQVLVSVISDVMAVLATNGTESMINLPQVGQQAKLTFSATAGQDWALQTTNLSLAGAANDSLALTINKPDGTPLQTASSCLEGAACAALGAQLPSSGTYTVVAAPSNALTGSFGVKLWLSNAVSAALSPGVVASLTTSTPGQRALYTFSGTSGAQVAVTLSGSTTISGAYVSLSVIAPSGAVNHLSWRQLSPAPAVVSLPALSESGTYKVYVSPSNQGGDATALTTFTASVAVGQDVTGLLPTDGTPAVLTTTQPSQRVIYQFSGTAGHDWSVWINSLALNGGSNDKVDYVIKNPDGTTLTSGVCEESGIGCSNGGAGLPMTGSYTLTVTPQTAVSGTYSVRLWQSPRLAGSMVLDVPVAVSTTIPGQRATYTFAGVAGQTVGFDLTSVMTSSYIAGAVALQVQVYSPSNALIASGSGGFSIGVLPATGTYRIEIGPAATAASFVATFTAQAKVYTLASGTVLATDGTPLNVVIAQPGQFAEVTFNGVSGKEFKFEISQLALNGGANDSMAYELRTPANAVYTTGTCSENGTGCNLTLLSLPASGTYKIKFTPSGGLTGNFRVRGFMTSPVTGTLSIGTAATITTTVPGQAGRYTLSGTAGQTLRLTVSNVSSSTSGTFVGVYLYAPNFAYVGGTGLSLGGAPATIDLPALPSTGTYKVDIVGVPAEATFSVQVLFAVSTGGTSGGTLPTDGTIKTVTFATPGETVDLSFDATAGEDFSVQFTQLALNGGASDSMQYTLVPPQGSPYTPLSCVETTPTCGLTTYMSLSTGTYKLRLIAQAGLTGSVKVEAWKFVPLTGNMVVGTPVTVTTTTVGQIGRFTFNGTTGQQLQLSLNNASSPTGAWSIGVYVYAPNWSYVGGTSVSVGGTSTVALPPLPADGVYKVQFSAYPQGTFSVQALIAP